MLDVDLSTLALYVSNVVTSFQNTQNADIYSTQISQLLEYVDSLSVSTSRIEIINSYISLFDGVYDFKNDILSLL